jgi:glutamyl-tRNA reductase
MLHGAMAELQAADGASRDHTAQAISRLFLRGKPPEPRM